MNSKGNNGDWFDEVVNEVEIDDSLPTIVPSNRDTTFSSTTMGTGSSTDILTTEDLGDGTMNSSLYNMLVKISK